MSITPIGSQGTATRQNVAEQALRTEASRTEASPTGAPRTELPRDGFPVARPSLLKAKIIGAFHAILETLHLSRSPKTDTMLRDTKLSFPLTTPHALGMVDAMAAPRVDRAALLDHLAALNSLQSDSSTSTGTSTGTSPGKSTGAGTKTNFEALQEAQGALFKGPKSLDNFALVRINERLEGNFFKDLRADIAYQVAAGDSTLAGVGDKLDTLSKSVKSELFARGYDVSVAFDKRAEADAKLIKRAEASGLSTPGKRFANNLHARVFNQKVDTTTAKKTLDLMHDRSVFTGYLGLVARTTPRSESPQEAFNTAPFLKDSNRPSISITTPNGETKPVHVATGDANPSARPPSAKQINDGINANFDLSPEAANLVSRLVTSHTSDAMLTRFVDGMRLAHNERNAIEGSAQRIQLDVDNQSARMTLRQDENGNILIDVDQTAYINQTTPQQSQNPTRRARTSA